MTNFGKRALKKAQTKLNILQAMLELIADTNFKDMKVKDIVEKVRITEMTFFNYFKTKDDMHLASCFYGDALVAYTSGADIRSLYQRSLDLIFEGYKGIRVNLQ